MRRLILASTLLLAACATRPQQQSVEEAPPPVSTSPQTRSVLGLTANELLGYFGKPALQIREGSSLKLQFRSRQCVLDAYLYPSRGGQLRVTHLDARAASGVDVDQAACVASLESPS
jgi:hypothetical protein